MSGAVFGLVGSRDVRVRVGDRTVVVMVVVKVMVIIVCR